MRIVRLTPRVCAATAVLVEGRAGASALHGLGVDHHHRRVGLPVVAESDLAGEDAHRRRPGAAVAPAPPLAPHRLPVGEPVGQVPPLAPGPREPQDRVHDVPPRDRALDAPVDERVEEVLDQPPLLVRQLDHHAHGRSLPAARDISNGTDGLPVRRQSATGSHLSWPLVGWTQLSPAISKPLAGL
jgi:hypothetical protein